MMEFEIIEKIKKTREYLDYLEEHIFYINKAFEIVKEKCKDMRFISDNLFYEGLYGQIRYHDISKMSEKEFAQYREYFHPTEKEKQNKESNKINPLILDAFSHHKESNLHHWENWTKVNLTGNPDYWEVHCAHMIIDWMAMSFKFGDTAKDFYEKNKTHIKLPDYAIDFIYEIFDRISNEKNKTNTNS